MEINEKTLDNLITKTENISKVANSIIDNQKNIIKTIQDSINASQEKLANELLGLASEMFKNGLSTYSGRLEEYVVNNVLQAPYDFKKAFSTHKAIFAERHKMAMFLYRNLEKIKDNAKNNLEQIKATKGNKIKVFTYWDSSDDLPPIIKLCQESLKKYINKDKFELIILNKESYKEWTTFRFEDINAKLGQAHLTDILRLKLLEQWGGFWLDATCLLTEDFWKATENIRQQEQFLFTYVTSRTGNWFIYSQPNNYIISMILSALLLWWDTQKYLTNYFMFHDIVEMFYWVDPEYRQHWNSMQSVHPRNALALLKDYNKKCTEEEFNNLLKGHFVHKLTYKYDKTKVVSDSVLDKLIGLCAK